MTFNSVLKLAKRIVKIAKPIFLAVLSINFSLSINWTVNKEKISRLLLLKKKRKAKKIPLNKQTKNTQRKIKNPENRRS